MNFVILIYFTAYEYFPFLSNSEYWEAVTVIVVFAYENDKLKQFAFYG